MGMYGFKAQFWPYLLDGTKTHTIRCRRSHPDGPGDVLYQYGNPRRRDCFLIQEVTCTLVKPVSLGRAWVELDGVKLTADERDGFAWRDGFRPPGSTAGRPGAAFELMASFWRESELPVIDADCIHWSLPRLRMGPNAAAMLEVWAMAAGRADVEGFARGLQQR